MATFVARVNRNLVAYDELHSIFSRDIEDWVIWHLTLRALRKSMTVERTSTDVLLIFPSAEPVELHFYDNLKNLFTSLLPLHPHHSLFSQSFLLVVLVVLSLL